MCLAKWAPFMPWWSLLCYRNRHYNSSDARQKIRTCFEYALASKHRGSVFEYGLDWCLLVTMMRYMCVKVGTGSLHEFNFNTSLFLALTSFNLCVKIFIYSVSFLLYFINFLQQTLVNIDGNQNRHVEKWEGHNNWFEWMKRPQSISISFTVIMLKENASAYE